jgi:hypothetical protein
MQFLKKHYEKVLLSIVLLGLAGAAAALPWQISHERDRLEEIRRNLTVKAKAKPFKPLDDWLTTNRTVLARLHAPLNLELAGSHNLFNPVPWKRVQGNLLMPIRTGSELGPGALKIQQIKPLNLEVSFDSVNLGASPGDAPKYHVTVRRETDSNPRPNTKIVSTTHPRTDLLELVSVQGPPADPTALVLKLKDEFEAIVVAKDKPFARIAGFAADLLYPPANQKFNHRKVNDQLRLEDDPETYKIVAINQNEVVLSADSNKRRWIIKYHGSDTASIK